MALQLQTQQMSDGNKYYWQEVNYLKTISTGRDEGYWKVTGLR